MPAYARGTLAWGLCMRCGLRMLYRELVFDGYFPNLRVCPGCYDAPQPQERLAIVSDPVALWHPAPDSYLVPPPFLTAAIVASQVVLSWTSIMAPPPGADGRANQGAELSAGYVVQRSIDNVNWTTLATLLNTADEYGALSVETLTYTDTSPPAGTLFYRIRGYDVLEGAEYG